LKGHFLFFNSFLKKNKYLQKPYKKQAEHCRGHAAQDMGGMCGRGLLGVGKMLSKQHFSKGSRAVAT
jgi:hypothetical protein